jgi:putative ribosome biogenesis GTPase RsgA
MLVTTIIQPNLKMGFIDRFLLMTEPHDIPVIIVVTKSDLWRGRRRNIRWITDHVPRDWARGY